MAQKVIEVVGTSKESFARLRKTRWQKPPKPFAD
jgi:hypothetical protein